MYVARWLQKYSCQEQEVECRRRVLISKSTVSVINKATLCTQIHHMWRCFSHYVWHRWLLENFLLVLRTPFPKLSQLADPVVGTYGNVYSLKTYN